MAISTIRTLPKNNPHWLWHAIDHQTGTVLAYVFGRRKDEVFLKLKALLDPFGLTHYYTDKWDFLPFVNPNGSNILPHLHD